MVDLSTINGPDYIILSAKTKREFFCAIQEAVSMEFSNPAERRSISQLAMKLRQLWGMINSSFRSLRFICTFHHACIFFFCLLVLNAKRVFGAIVVSKSRGNQVNVQIMEIQSKLKHNTCDSLLLYPNLKSLKCHIVW